MTKSAPPPKSLRQTVLAVLIPLAAIVLTGVAVEIWMARAVHADLVRLFGELREVERTQSVVDELHGVEAWIKALPSATPASHPYVLADVRQHFDEARDSIGRISRASTTSLASHGEDVNRLIEELDASLALLGKELDKAVQLADVEPHLRAAIYKAQAVANSVGSESHAIGNELDTRTNHMARMLLVLGLASIAAVAGLGFLLLRRVLRPVSELRDSAVRLGHGDQDVQLPIRRPDELGELARAFGNMTQQIRQHRQELEQRVEERSREVLRTAKLAQLGTLAAGIAHEINNPLASIVACSDGLLRDIREGTSDTDNMRDYLQILRKEAMRTRDITTKLLRFARDDGQTRERMWLSAQVHEVAALFDHQMADAGIKLEVNWASEIGDSDVAILGDPSEWRQVFFNLLGNAMDASPRDSTITVTGRHTGHEVEVAVHDQGSGIPHDLLERVFEPFFTTKGPGQGTGLGLAIVHRIVVAHGGRIRILNDKPGTTVVINVPAAQDANNT